jgi:hypothetical protein
MEIVTGDPAPVLDRDEAARLLVEMAAVVRTVFAVPAPVAAPTAVRIPAPPVAEVPRTAAIPVAGLPVPALPVAALPVPVPESPDSAERRSMTLLQEIAFLDD